MIVPIVPVDNHLLAALPAAKMLSILPFLELMQLSKGEVLAESGSPRAFGYFPVGAVLSTIYLSRDGNCTGTSMVGREGMLGATLILGGNTMPEQSQVLYPGHAYRLPASMLQFRSSKDQESLQVLLQFVHSLILQISQIAACTRHHGVAQRLSRFLLMSLDRLPSNTVPVTQETIAQILGVRRESVTEGIARLLHSHIVDCRRGYIVVLDRSRLEQSSCECYAMDRRPFLRRTPAAKKRDGIVATPPAFAWAAQ
jgi:CRP-like cAMP-binding protein